MANKEYGLVTDIQLDFGESVFEMRGIPKKGDTFHQVLTRRAAQLMWYALTKNLFMGEAPPLTAAAGTAPLTLHDDPDMTMRVDVTKLNEDLFELRGVTRSHVWLIQATSAEMQWVWATLDVNLYPVGWEGRDAAQV